MKGTSNIFYLCSNLLFRYKILAPRKKLKDVKAQVLAIVEALNLDEDKYKIGITKIFLRSGQVSLIFA